MRTLSPPPPGPIWKLSSGEFLGPLPEGGTPQGKGVSACRTIGKSGRACLAGAERACRGRQARLDLIEIKSSKSAFFLANP